MAGPDDLFDLCAEWLAACEAAIAPTFGGPIACAYVSAGAPIYDTDELLAVYAGGPTEGDTAPLQPPLQPGHRTSTTGAVHLAQLTAIVMRCSALMGNEDGELPTPDENEIVARKTMADVWSIWNHTRHAYRAGVLFPSPSGTRELFFDGAVPTQNQGGLSGWQIPIRVQLPGYSIDPDA